MEPLYSKNTKNPRIVLQKHSQLEQPHPRPFPDLLDHLSKLLPAKQPPPDFPTFFRRLLIVLTCGTLGLLYLHHSNALPNPEFHAGHAGSNVLQDDVQIEHVISCSQAANRTDPCLVERPAGVIILAHMYDPDLGTADGWGTHGLWPNFCNGSYPTSCSPEREFSDVQTLLRRKHANFLLNYMQFTWKNSANTTGVNGTDADLWAHEWNKHGTCLSTLQPSCYQGYDSGDEVVDYFETTIKLSKSLPTRQFLEACSIVPSGWKTYALKGFEDCLSRFAGARPRVGCDHEGRLNEVWWYHHLEGNVKAGKPIGFDSTSESSCPKEGIRYLPKSQ